MQVSTFTKLGMGCVPRRMSTPTSTCSGPSKQRLSALLLNVFVTSKKSEVIVDQCAPAHVDAGGMFVMQN